MRKEIAAQFSLNKKRGRFPGKTGQGSMKRRGPVEKWMIKMRSCSRCRIDTYRAKVKRSAKFSK